MAGWILLIAFFLTPLTCWTLLARTRVLGWTFAMVFAAYAVTEVFLIPGWLFGDRFGGERLWLILGLPVMSVVALAVGTHLENRDLDVPRMRSTRRGSASMILSSLYALAVAGLLFLAALIGSALGGGSFPSSLHALSNSYVLPLGPGLTVTQDQLGCGTSECTTDYYVSYPRLSERAALQQVVNQLDRIHGWAVSIDGGLAGCRKLGGQDACVQVVDARASKMIMIELDSGPQLEDG